MNHLQQDRLIDLALGSTADPGEHEHLAECAACATSRAAFAETIAATRRAGTASLSDPPSRLWDSIRAEIAGDSATSRDARTASVTSLSERPSRRRGPATTWLVAAACVIGIILGVGGASIVDRIRGAAGPAQTSLASAPLAPLDSAERQGVATLVDRDGDLRLDLPAMDLDAGGGYLEVWLINRDLTRMVSIGVIPPGASQIVLPVSQELIDEGYVIVDISREPFDDEPAHSGETLVRGELSI